MLKIEDVKVGDALECIDRDGYINQDNGSARIRKQILKGPIVVFEITKNGVSLTRSGLQIPLDSLKHFKKKEQSQHTFDDLIDVAVQAFRDGMIRKLTIDGCGIFFDALKNTYGFGDAEINSGVDFIQSLYKETFVIECEEDIKRVKSNAKVTLANNETFIAVDDYVNCGLNLVGCDYKGVRFALSLLALRGATVEQERTRND